MIVYFISSKGSGNTVAQRWIYLPFSANVGVFSGIFNTAIITEFYYKTLLKIYERSAKME